MSILLNIVGLAWSIYGLTEMILGPFDRGLLALALGVLYAIRAKQER